MWRKVKLLACLLCAGGGIAWLAAAAVQAQNPAPGADADAEHADVRSLQAEVDALREQVAELEERLSAIENRGGIQLLDFPPAPHVGPGMRIVPEASRPRRVPQGEINGVPYYVIPLGEE